MTFLGGSKEKKPSGKVGVSQDDLILASRHQENVASHPVVLPDHLKEHDNSQHIYQGSELHIDPKSFHETAIIRGKIKESQMRDSFPYQSSELGKLYLKSNRFSSDFFDN